MKRSVKIDRRIEETDIREYLSLMFESMNGKNVAYCRTEDCTELDSQFDVTLTAGIKPQEELKSAVIYHYMNKTAVDFVKITFIKDKTSVSYHKLAKMKQEKQWTMDTKRMNWKWLERQLKMAATGNS